MEPVVLYLLDSAPVIDHQHGDEATILFVSSGLEVRDQFAISVVTLSEFYSGIRRGERPDMDQFIDQLRQVPTSRRIALKAAEYRYEFARRGRQLNIADTIIAATAYVINATLVTSNLRDFPMIDIRVTDGT